MTRIILALLLAAAPAMALAQSSTATSGTTKPLQSAPTSGNTSGPKAVIPPAARSGEKGLRVGEGAVTGDNPIEIKRNK
jgi:hypothetical protein